MTQRKKYKRRIKLIKPRLQLKLVGTFLGISALGFIMQALLVSLRLTESAAELPRSSGPALMAMVPKLPIEILLLSFGLVLPLTFAIGVLTTFRMAGPVYRFEQFLRAVADGEETEPCRLRKGDELTDLCAIINEVTEPLRKANAADEAERAEYLESA